MPGASRPTLGLHLALDCVPNLENWQADAGAAGCRAADRGQRIQEEKVMKCVICKHGETKKGRISVTLERDGMTLVFKEVPAQVCSNCGEEYVDEEITSRLLKTAEESLSSGVMVDIRQYKAA